MAVDPGPTSDALREENETGIAAVFRHMGIMLHIFFGTALETWVGFGCETAELIRRRRLGFGVEPVTGRMSNGREC